MAPTPNIGIVGAGAMGSLFAYFFSRAHADIVLYDTPERVEALTKGIEVRLLNGTCHSIYAAASSAPEGMRACDIIFIFVKSYNTRQAAKTISPHISPDAIFVTLQNGLGNKEILEELFPRNPIVSGATTIGAHINADGIIVEGGSGSITVGSTDTGALEKIMDLFHQTNLPAEITHNPDATLWRKAIINAAINPLGALLRIPNGMIVESSHLRAIQAHIVQEAVTAAQAERIAVDADELIAAVITVCGNTAQNRCSMLQDIEAGRRTEINAITGAIIARARKHGIATPYNDVLYGLIAALEEQKKTGVAPGVI